MKQPNFENAPDITYRAAASEDDVRGSNEMRAQSWVDTYPNEEYGISREWVEKRVAGFASPETVKRHWEEIVEHRGKERGETFVAVDGAGKVIGSTSVLRREGDAGRLGALYVDKDYHGQGVASELMRRALDFLDAKNNDVTLGVAVYNDRAKAFYEKWNFHKISGKVTKYADTIPEVEMKRFAGEYGR